MLVANEIKRNIKGVALAILLSMSVIALGNMNTMFGLRSVSAAGETVTASKSTFFGSNAVEVTITDDSLKDNNEGAEQDELSVSFNVQSGSDSASETVHVGDDGADISAEIGDSGKFVFYVTADADVTAGDLNDPRVDDAQMVFIGEGGDVDIGADSGNSALEGAIDGISLDEGATITITYRDSHVTLTYDDTKADVSLDRTTVGTEGFVYLQVADQDANDDPTGRDGLNFDNTVGNLTMQFTGAVDTNLGQAIVDSGLDFKETSDNSGIFEVRLHVSDVFGISADNTPKTVKVEMRDFGVYPNDPFYDANEAGVRGNDKTSESVTVDNADGLFQDVTNPAGPRSDLAVKVLDTDRNLDSRVKDRIPKAIAADLSSGGTADDEPLASTPVDLIETDVNTGIFVPDLANNLFEVTVAPAVAHDGIVQIDSAASAKSDILVRYGDFTPDKASEATTAIAEGNAKVILFKGKAAANTPASLSLGQYTIGPQDTVALVLTDPDLNDDKDAVDSFDLTIPAKSFDSGSVTVTDITFNGVDIANLKLESVVAGEDADDTNPVSDITLSFQETGKDTGIFSAEFDYDRVASTNADGDNTKFKWTDQLLDTALDSSTRLTIHEADRAVAWQQNEYAVPYAPDGKTGATDLPGLDVDGLRTRIKLLITDPSLNKDSSTVEQKAFSLLDDAGDTDATATGFPDLIVKLVAPDGKVLLAATAGDIGSCGGLSSPVTFTETGANTGIFDKTFDFSTIPGGNCHDLEPTDLTDARLVATYEDSTASTIIRGYNAIITTSSRTLTSGQQVTITVNDPDQNHDRDVKEQVAIEIEPNGLPIVTKNIDETDLNTGVFSKTLKVGEDFPILDNEEVVDDVTIRYIDAISSNGDTSVERELTLLTPSGNGQLTITPDSNIGPATKITISLLDPDLNADPNIQDVIDFDALRIKTTNSDIADDEIRTGQDGLKMEETDNNSGLFKLTMTLVPITPEQKDSGEKIAFVASGDQLDFPAEPTDTIALSYKDDSHDKNSPDLLNLIIDVKAFDPTISIDKTAYLPGETMTVTVTDPDANRDPDIIDVLSDVRVFTPEDAVGESFDAVETGSNTGIFTFLVPIVEDSESGAIAAQIGDNVTIKYRDEIPANYDPDKERHEDFTYSVVIGKTAATSPDSTSPTQPQVQDFSGRAVSSVEVGQQIVLSTTITNNLDTDQPIVTIIEVRDLSGVTVFLGWQTGTLRGSDQSGVGLSFNPEQAGTYMVRTFVISNIDNPSILSSVKESEFTIS